MKRSSSNNNNDDVQQMVLHITTNTHARTRFKLQQHEEVRKCNNTIAFCITSSLAARRTDRFPDTLIVMMVG